MSYKIVFTNSGTKDYKTILQNPLSKRLKKILTILRENPYQKPTEKLVGFKNTYSKRLNIQHRVVYEIIEERKIVKILSCWTHYDNLK